MEKTNPTLFSKGNFEIKRIMEVQEETVEV